MRYSKFLTLSAVLLMNNLAGICSGSFQDETKAIPDYNFSCTQNEREFLLKAKLSYWTGERDIPIYGALVKFQNIAGEESHNLNAVTTNMKGVAEFRIPKLSEKLIPVDGSLTFSAVFEGNREYEPAEEMLEVRLLNISIDFQEIDSVKTIIIEALEIDRDGNRIPLDATDIYCFVTRSFSLLPAGEGWFEEGRATMEFPTSMPGDSAGNLTIVARMEDHELYGNVEVVAVKNWGVARPLIVAEKRRGLGDTDAPLWMVYTLIVLLSVVWFHYMYVFYAMIKIKRLRRSQEV